MDFTTVLSIRLFNFLFSTHLHLCIKESQIKEFCERVVLWCEGQHCSPQRHLWIDAVLHPRVISMLQLVSVEVFLRLWAKLKGTGGSDSSFVSSVGTKSQPEGVCQSSRLHGFVPPPPIHEGRNAQKNALSLWCEHSGDVFMLYNGIFIKPQRWQTWKDDWKYFLRCRSYCL